MFVIRFEPASTLKGISNEYNEHRRCFDYRHSVGLRAGDLSDRERTVDSTRPTQTGEAGQAPAEVPAYARLWDDPFAVYQDTDKVKPAKPSLFTIGGTLVLIVPTKTQPYEDDIENRIRIRYAIERALFDQGYAAEAGNLLSTIDIGSPVMDPGKKPDSDGLVQVAATV